MFRERSDGDERMMCTIIDFGNGDFTEVSESLEEVAAKINDIKLDELKYQRKEV